MSTLTIDNQVTVTSASSTLNISVVSGQRLNVITVTGPVGPSGAPGLPGTGAVDLSGYVLTSRTINTHALTGDVTVLARDIPVDFVPGAGYSNLQQFINVMHSPGLIDGAIITDGGGGNALVSPGTGMLRVADDNISSLAFVSISGTSLAVPPDLIQYYIGFVYNGGHPMFELRATNDWDNDTEIALGTVVNFFGQLIITNNPFLVGDPITNIIQRFDAMAPVSRDEMVGGLTLGEIGSRNVTLSAGKLWIRLNDYEVEAVNTAVSGSIYSAYYNGSFWNYNVGVTQWDNLQYNDITAGLMPLQPGYFANLWFYLTIENNSLGFIYGQDQLGNLSDASNEGAPSFLPANFLNGSILVGRMIFHSGALVTDAIDSAFTTQFASSPVTAHNNLAGIQGGLPGEYYHLKASDYNSVTNLADHFTLNSTLSLTGTSGANLDLGNGGRLGASAFTGVSGINGLTGGIYIGGSQGISVSQSGQTIYVSGQDWATNTSLGALSGYVTGVSGGLQAQITAGGGTQVKISGSTTLVTANFTGLGGTLVFSSGGFVFVSGAVGAGGVTQAQLDSLSGWSASAVNLTATGATITARETLISGILTTGLLNTGQQLYSLVTGLSGQANTNYATASNLTLTGSGLYSLVTGMSGQDVTNYATKANLGLTGQQLYAYVTATSGTIGTTGTTLYNLVTALSGQLNNNHASTGALLATGQSLYVYITATSGTIGTTGTTLYNLITSLSGQANTNYASTGNLLLTGQTLYNNIVLASGAAQNNGINLSGQLTQTGVQLVNSLNALSGYVTGVSGGLQAQIIGAGGTQVKVTGSATLGTVNLTGVGTVSLTMSGSTVLISGTAAGGGVSAINSLAGAIFVTGTGLITVLTLGQNLVVSGDNSISGALTSTGVLLGSSIGATGQSLYAYVTAASGAVGATGITLYNLITALSGQSNVNYATTGNLLATGQLLYNLTTALSGQLNNNHASTGALLATGQALYAYVTTTSGAVGATGTTLYNLVTALSGQSNVNYATTGGLLATGQALYAYVLGTSGAVGTTGTTLYNLLTGLSGQANINYATATNLALTGSNLFAILTGMSGQDIINYATKTQLTLSGVILSAVKVSGSAIINVVDFTGIGGTLVFSSGGQIFVSGGSSAAGGGSNVSTTGSATIVSPNFTGIGTTIITYDGTYVRVSGAPAGTGAGVSSLNAQTNAVQITGTGGFVVSQVGGIITISGLTTVVKSQVVFMNSGGILSGDNSLYWNEVNDTLTVSNSAIHLSGINVVPTGTLTISGLFLDNNSLNASSGKFHLSGMANNPIAAMYVSGWGNTYYAPAAYNRRIRTIVPATTTTQFVTNDTAANVGTLSTLLSETLGEVTQYTPTIGLSAGTSFAIASAFRGSVAGVGNGFFFVTKFLLNQAYASGLNIGTYGAPSGSRIFVGLTDQAVATQTQLNEPAGNFVGLSYLWASGGAAGTGQYQQNWSVRSRDNVATSTGDIGMVFQTGYYRFAMYCPPFPGNTQVYYQLDDIMRGSGVKGQITQNLPVGSTAMRGMAAIGFVSGVKTIGTSVVYQETPNSSTIG